MRGTTPTFIFHLKYKDGSPFDTALFVDGRVTFKQGTEIINEKKLSECNCLDDTITVTLTQEETLKFNASRAVKIQIKGKTQDGKIIPTVDRTVSCKDIFNEEVL